MIKVKHVFDAVERDDGVRLWVEPINLTCDLRAWCDVDYVMTELGAPIREWARFAEHPDGYAAFRRAYHDRLARDPCLPLLRHLAGYGATRNITLLHQGDDLYRNSAAALLEFLVGMQAGWST